MEERRSRFTNYSMSSAVIKRPDGLQIIDEHFEALYEQYDDNKLGQAEEDDEELSGFIEHDSERFQELLQEHIAQKKPFFPLVIFNKYYIEGS